MKHNKQKNVIWFMSDQHRGQALSRHGDPNVVTPNMDNLADCGVDFPRAVSGFPLCVPFRGSLITGRYPHNCGVSGHEYPLDTSVPTIADHFNNAGYQTAWFGKWHLDGCKENPDSRAALHTVPPERRGRFKTWIGYENNNSPFDSWVHGCADEKEVRHYRLPGYETDALTDMGIDYLQKMKEADSPFFMVISVQPPHDPYTAPPEFMSKYNPQNIKLRPNVPASELYQNRSRRFLAGACAMIENLDWNIGRLTDQLRQLDLLDDTHLVLFSDHGNMLGSHGQLNKTSPYEESIRIPFIISGTVPYRHPGSKFFDSDALVNHVDIAPTTLGLCGIDIPEDMEGYDYSYKRIKKDPPAEKEPDSAYLQQVAVSGNPFSVDKPWRGIVTKDGWKYACFENAPWMMFNLNDDPFEQANLAHNSLYYSKQNQLLNELKKWIKKTGDHFELPVLNQ